MSCNCAFRTTPRPEFQPVSNDRHLHARVKGIWRARWAADSPDGGHVQERCFASPFAKATADKSLHVALQDLAEFRARHLVAPAALPNMEGASRRGDVSPRLKRCLPRLG